MVSLSPLPLPPGISSYYVDCPSVGLNIHYLEAGRPSEGERGKLVLLLHGFPELAFSWRKVIPSLAADGYHVIAPDQRGYGRTTGWDNAEWSKTNLNEFTATSLVRDMVTFVYALGYSKVYAVVGHDFGAVSASMCVLMRPDMFNKLVLMSHPYKAVPNLPEANTADGCVRGSQSKKPDINAELAALIQPRIHYRVYNSTQRAANDWINPPQGLKAYLRGYIHIKSADWERNQPHPLEKLSGAEMAKMPDYYIMPKGSTFPEVVTHLMEGEDVSLTKSWLPDDALDIYVQEWSRSGFQGGLNWYRARTEPGFMSDLTLFAGRKIQVPTKFISGEKDWGNFQEPGALDSMKETCEQFHGSVFISDAGHWPQQEQPERVAEAILDFLSPN
jgi:pimeloyl-ACP methyl ester carboxylesterase